jgi:Uma2 family endonuclease
MALLAAPRPVYLTYEDYRRTPDDGRRYELFDGEIYVTPAPSTSHQRASRNLEFLLHQHVRQHRLGEIFDAPVDVLLDRGTVLQPDIVFVSRERSGMVSERGIEGPPDLVAEILSPATEEHDRGLKQQLYARHGVRHYWILDTNARSLSELVLTGGAYSVRATTIAPASARTAVFPDLDIDLGEVFAGP